MKQNAKVWFIQISRTLWIPLSWEGWCTTFVFVAVLFFIYTLNGVSDEIPFQLTEHWPILLEMGIATAAFYWISHGHVKKRT